MKTEYSQTEKLWIYLSTVTGLGPVTFYKILSEAVDVVNFYDNAEDILLKVNLPEAVEAGIRVCVTKARMDDFFELLQKLKVSAYCCFNPEYPLYLNDIPTPPPVLYARGDVMCINDRTVAVVGTRKCTKEGYAKTKEIACELAKNGVSIISGLAMGIDSAAHVGALEGQGITLGVMAGGVENVYPKSNEALYNQIIERGAVISENPPGVPVLSGAFPARNRIIAGLCRGVVIGESPMKSGTAITLKYAADFDRNVFALAGQGHLYALAQSAVECGAVEVTCADDILLEMDWEPLKNNNNTEKVQYNINKVETISQKPKVVLDFYEQELYNLLLNGYCDLEDILQKLNIPPAKLNTMITMMELNGLIERTAGKRLKIK